MSESSKGLQEPTHEEICARAQRLYESEGRPNGKALDHWLKAEAQLRSEKKAQPAPTQKKGAKPATPEAATKSRNTTPWQGQQNASRQPATHN